MVKTTNPFPATFTHKLVTDPSSLQKAEFHLFGFGRVFRVTGRRDSSLTLSAADYLYVSQEEHGRHARKWEPECAAPHLNGAGRMKTRQHEVWQSRFPGDVGADDDIGDGTFEDTVRSNMIDMRQGLWKWNCNPIKIISKKDGLKVGHTISLLQTIRLKEIFLRFFQPISLLCRHEHCRLQLCQGEPQTPVALRYRNWR